MIKKQNAILLPDNFFPDAELSFHNATNEIQNVLIHRRHSGIDESIYQYISNPDLKIHVAPHLKKVIQINAQLISSDKELLSAKYVVPLRKEYKSLRGIKVDALQKLNAPAGLKKLLADNLEWDLISKSDIVILPIQKYSFNSLGRRNEWYATRDFLDSTDFFTDCFVTAADVTVFDYISLLYCSDNRPMSEDELYKIKKLLSIDDTKQMALEVMNVLNPANSFIELMIAFNAIPDDMKKKNKARILPLMQEMYNLDVTISSYALENITNYYKKWFAKELSQEQLEFICDHYESKYVEKSSIFEFQLKLKK